MRVEVTKPCEQCDGEGERVLNPNWPSGDESYSEKCPDCVNGRVSVEELYEVEGIEAAREEARRIIEILRLPGWWADSRPTRMRALPESGGTIELPDGVRITVTP